MDVVTLEVPDYSQHPEITYEVKYKNDPVTNLMEFFRPAAP